MTFDDIVNSICREFRRVRDQIIKLSDADLEKEIDKFWGGMPWYVCIFRKLIMKEVHKRLKDLF